MNLEQLLLAIPELPLFDLGAVWTIIFAGTFVFITYAIFTGGYNLQRKIKALKAEVTISYLILLSTFLAALAYMQVAGVQSTILGIIIGMMFTNLLKRPVEIIYQRNL